MNAAQAYLEIYLPSQDVTCPLLSSNKAWKGGEFSLGGQNSKVAFACLLKSTLCPLPSLLPLDLYHLYAAATSPPPATITSSSTASSWGGIVCSQRPPCSSTWGVGTLYFPECCISGAFIYQDAWLFEWHGRRLFVAAGIADGGGTAGEQKDHRGDNGGGRQIGKLGGTSLAASPYNKPEAWSEAQ